MPKQRTRKKAPPIVKIVLNGLEDEKGRVRLNDFVEQLNGIASAMRKAGVTDSSSRRPDVYFRIVSLSSNSPLTVEMEMVTQDVDDAAQVADSAREFFGLLKEINKRGEISRQVDYGVLESVRQLAAPMGKTLASTSVSLFRTTVPITPRFRAQFERVLAPEQVAGGSVRGMLEFINLHGNKKVFRIYPDAGPRRIKCLLRDEQVADAIASVGKFVEVRGIVHYKASATHAHEIEVASIQVLPTVPVEALQALRGIAPDLTGGLTSEEYIRNLRAD